MCKLARPRQAPAPAWRPCDDARGSRPGTRVPRRVPPWRSGPGARAAAGGSDEDFATSPMTGTLAKLSVEPGTAVAEGGELFVVEAMKMEYVVKAPRDVMVAEVRGSVGGQVDQGAVVVTFESEGDA